MLPLKWMIHGILFPLKNLMMSSLETPRELQQNEPQPDIA